jgi:hypothetical protein
VVKVNARARVAIVACVGGVVALVATAIWLASWSDGALARWSAVAAVVSGLVSVFALVVAIVPLWLGDDGRHARDQGERQIPGTTVTQNVLSNGPVHMVGEGSQVNMDIRLPPSDGL